MYNRRRGIMMQLLSTSIPLSSLPQGSLIGIAESGVIKPFLLAKTNYESSGRTLLLRKFLYKSAYWHYYNTNTYASSYINGFCNATFINLLDAGMQSLISAISIPYTIGGGDYTVSHINRKAFVLSGTEVGFTGVSNMNVEGSDLGLFTTSASRIAYLESDQTNAVGWWTRSPKGEGSAFIVGTTGGTSNGAVSISEGFRPAFTLSDSQPMNPTPTAEGYYLPIV